MPDRLACWTAIFFAAAAVAALFSCAPVRQGTAAALTASGSARAPRSAPEGSWTTVERLATPPELGMVTDIRRDPTTAEWIVSGVGGVARFDASGRLLRSAALERPAGSRCCATTIALVEGRVLLVPGTRAGSSFNAVEVFSESGRLECRLEPFGPDRSPFESVLSLFIDEGEALCYCISSTERLAVIDLRRRAVATVIPWPRSNGPSNAAMFDRGRLTAIATASGRDCILLTPQGDELWRERLPGRYFQSIVRAVEAGQEVLLLHATPWNRDSPADRWVLSVDRAAPGALRPMAGVPPVLADRWSSANGGRAGAHLALLGDGGGNSLGRLLCGILSSVLNGRWPSKLRTSAALAEARRS